MKNQFPKEFELEVLRALIQDQKFLKEGFTIMRPEYMSDGMYQSAMTVILGSYLKTKKPPSKAGFFSELVNEERARVRVKKNNEEDLLVEPCRKLTDTLFQISLNNDDVKLKYLDFCRQREMGNALLDASSKLESGEIDASKAAENIRKAQQRINCQSQGGRDMFLDIDDIPGILDRIQSTCNTTGFKSLDTAMGGGMGLGTLTTIVAPAKGGKSMALLNVGYSNIRRGKKVIYFTLEIDEDRVIKRFCSRITGIPQKELKDKSKQVVDSIANFWAMTKSELRVKEFLNGATVNDFRSYLYWLDSEHGFKPDVVLIDYGDLVRPTTRQKELRHDLREAYTEMRAMVKEFNVSGATAAQCNRESMNKSIIKMQDVAEAIDTCRISDHIITICKTEEEERENKGRLFFAGSREAETGRVIPIRYDWTTCNIYESMDKV